MTCLAAHTVLDVGGYPPYISINLKPDDKVEITVRSKANADGTCGDAGLISLSLDEFRRLLTELYAEAP